MIVILTALLLGADPVGDRVVAFARAQVGQRVGDGECSALAVEALRQAGAQPRAGGAWGAQRASLKEAQPGDILQFEGATFVRTRSLPSGALVTLTIEYPHHTAIVARVRKRGPRPVLVILHQNAGGAQQDDDSRKVVQEWTLNMAELRAGKVVAFRPVAD